MEVLLHHIRQSLSEWAMSVFDLKQQLEADQWDLELWANVNGKGHFNKAHDHFRAGIVATGCYYLHINDRRDEGRIVFINRQSIPSFVDSGLQPPQQTFAIAPDEGQYLIFPSWLGHQVEAHTYQGERISLTFNAGHPDLQVKRKGDRELRRGLKDLLKQLGIV